MIQDIDIHRSAKALIDQHGENALVEAINRAAHFKASGDEEGKNVWLRIADSIGWMLLPENLTGKTVQ
jgi:hypothetical protein